MISRITRSREERAFCTTENQAVPDAVLVVPGKDKKNVVLLEVAMQIEIEMKKAT